MPKAKDSTEPRRAGKARLPTPPEFAEWNDFHAAFGQVVEGAAKADPDFQRDLMFAAVAFFYTATAEDLGHLLDRVPWGRLIGSDRGAIQRFWNGLGSDLAHFIRCCPRIASGTDEKGGDS